MDYLDDPDQLPALPDPGPRDGRHGVDRDEDYDPFPSTGSHSTADPLAVSEDEAKWHLGVLVARATSGEEIVIMRKGVPLARIVPPRRRAVSLQPPVAAPLVATDPASALSAASAAASATAQLSRRAQKTVPTPTLVVTFDELIRNDGVLLERHTLILDDPEQLPELPDPGPRDGRHGVDRETGEGQPIRRPSRRTARRTASGN
ncbi:type II toxin-antitoxin system Phd/YefM family antitoxin [Glaciibacter psychrotolerans]|uniref:Antitoxin (DNA-binding transcriptional repressor) of toxin-antitoxin stability system n=1 Tax=Glaciibacter psychrotolerans TaxID=670054 RepID=A0A7Z0J6G3_9MICO|nr:hypothetical protein [Leifsonia psychrotolerans]NYJ19913.1 antitoxin (DNA-binding transcriptional repressor) of toxin-antitoxin stability system [Leifsonia psychrotolerans]